MSEDAQSPDVTAVVEKEPVPAAATQKTVRVKKDKAGKGNVAVTNPEKPKVRGLTDLEKLERVGQIDAQVAGGATLKDAVKTAGISDETYYQWKKKAATQPVEATAQPAIVADDEFAEFARLEEENRRLRTLLSEKLRAENAELRKRLGIN